MTETINDGNNLPSSQRTARMTWFKCACDVNWWRSDVAHDVNDCCALKRDIRHAW